MILVDNNQIVFANVFQMAKNNEMGNVDLLRHLVLNTYRMYKSKFGNQYGELVICHDSGNVWRKEHFPHYKASRRVAQKNMGIKMKKKTFRYSVIMTNIHLCWGSRLFLNHLISQALRSRRTTQTIGEVFRITNEILYKTQSTIKFMSHSGLRLM